MSRAIKRIAALGIGKLLALGFLLGLTLLRAPRVSAQPVVGLGGVAGGQTTQPVYQPDVTLPARAAPCATPSPGAGAIAQPDPASWAQFGFDAADTRCNPYENRLSPSVVPNLHLGWSLTTAPYGVTPAVVNGIIYEPSSYPDNKLYAINATSHAIVWSAPIPTEVETSPTSPTVAGGIVYVGINNSLYTFNAATGKAGWSFTTGNELQTPPAVDGSAVYFASQDSTLYALDATTGALLWKAPTGGAYVPGPVAVANGAIYVAAGQELSAYDLSTGKSLWAISFPVSGSAPVAANGFIYIGGFDFNVYAFNAKTGVLVWKAHTGNVVNGTVAVDHDTAYIGSADGYLYAYNALTGQLNWAFGTNSGDAVFASAAVADGVVYITSACKISCGADSGTHIFAYTGATGTLLWKYAPGYAVYASPVVVDGTLYVSTYIGFDAFTA